MRPHVRLTAVPTGSPIAKRVAGSYFHDTYEVDVNDLERTALGHFLAAVSQTPAWVEVLMQLRNRIVGLVGLKNLGTLGGIDAAKPESSYKPGDRVGVFTLQSNERHEVIDIISHVGVEDEAHRLGMGDDERRMQKDEECDEGLHEVWKKVKRGG